MQRINLFSKLNKQTTLVSAIWGLIVSICLVWGYELETRGSIFDGGVKALLIWIVLFVAFSMVAYFVNIFLDKVSNDEPAGENKIVKKILYVCLFAAIIFILWFPAFLAVYPGWFNYDAPWQIYMYRDGIISSHHPVIHTYLLGIIVEKIHVWKVAHGDYAYNYNTSIAIYNVFQMLVCALGLGYQVEFIYDRILKKCKKSIRYSMTGIMLVFFGLYPPIVLLAMSPTKDVFFGIFYLLLIIEVYKIFRENRKPGVLFTILVILCTIYRQNTEYVFLLLAIPFLILLAKKYGRKHLLCGIICVAVSIAALFIYKGPFYSAMDIQPGSKVEFLSVPSQQIVSVYLNHGDELADEDKLLIEKLFSDEAFEGYRPKLADETKGNLNLDVMNSNKKSYASLYLRLFRQYPDEYFDSFLILNYGLWYPDATMDLYEDGKNLYFSNESQLAIISSKLPALENYYMSFGTVGHGLKRVLLMPGIALFLVFFVFLRGCRNRDTAVVLTGLATILILATFLLGPCASIRYLYYMYILVPLLIANAFIGKKR